MCVCSPLTLFSRHVSSFSEHQRGNAVKCVEVVVLLFLTLRVTRSSVFSANFTATLFATPRLTARLQSFKDFMQLVVHLSDPLCDECLDAAVEELAKHFRLIWEALPHLRAEKGSRKRMHTKTYCREIEGTRTLKMQLLVREKVKKWIKDNARGRSYKPHSVGRLAEESWLAAAARTEKGRITADARRNFAYFIQMSLLLALYCHKYQSMTVKSRMCLVSSLCC